MIPLSFAQQRLWFLDRVEGPNSTYNTAHFLRLDGPLEVAALEAALSDVVGRHESLRTVFPDVDGQPYQQVIDAGTPLEVRRLDDPGEEALSAALLEASGYQFDLATESSLRPVLFVLGPADHVLLLVMHHIASDGWSWGPLLRDLGSAYTARAQGRAPAWQPLPVQYADYALWQRDVLGGDDDPDSLLVEQLTFWRAALADLPEEISLPTDRSRPAVPSGRGAAVPISLDAETHERLAEVARGCGATLFMVLQAALACLLARLGAGVDVPLGTAVAGRTDAALDELIGFFVNTVVLRADLSGDPSFTELVGRVRETDLAAFAQQDLPFERVVEELNPDRVPGRHPLFQTMLVLQNNSNEQPELAGLGVRTGTVELYPAKFDLTFDLTESFAAEGRPAGITGSLTYATDLWDEVSVRRLVERFVGLAAMLARAPEARVWTVDVLSAGERESLARWNATAVEYPVGVPVHGVFEARVDATPDAVAVEFGAERVGYAQLDGWANRIAHRLLAVGVSRGALVGVCVERGPGMVAALLGVLKAGAGYVPLDPGHPDERIAAIVEQAGVAVVLSQGAVADRLPGQTRCVLLESVPAAGSPGADSSRPEVQVGGEDVACVLFTSGSTGRPKGVISPHRATVRTFTGQEYADFDQAWLQSAPVSWDGLSLELWSGLLNGGRCVLAPGQRPDPAGIAELVDAHQVNSLWLSAGLLATIADTNPQVFGRLHQVLTGGEAPSVAHLNHLRTHFPQLRLVHGYGPVESMVFSNAYQLNHTSNGRIPVGGPINNTQVHILDPRLNQLPPGAVGELYISGDGLAHGYLNQPGLTGQRFVANPYGPPGSRMYRTGDLARWTTGGTVEILGRADEQVKIRGFRIEPGEVEAALTSHSRVAQAAVIARTDSATGTRLIGYVVPVPGADLTPAEVTSHAQDLLPDYMLPAAIQILDALPLTPNGKLDQHALPVPDLQGMVQGRAPRTPRQQVLCALYTDLMGIAEVSIDDDFFALGGHSLLAARLASRIRTVFGVELGVQAVFTARTVVALDALLDTLGAARPAVRPAPRPDPLPLSHAQQRLWLQENLQGPSPAYNVPLALRLRGCLDTTALHAAIQDVVARHEPLRTMFPQRNDQPYQHILPAEQITVQLVQSLCAAEDLQQRLDAAAQQPFELGTELPVRAHLLTIAPDDHVLLLVLHHIAGDGWSMTPLLRDLTDAYTARRRGEAPAWQPLPVQYADYTLWQHDLLASSEDADGLLATQLDHWRTALADLPAEATLPADRPRPANPSYQGGLVRVHLDQALTAQLTTLARNNQATLAMVLQAGWAALLSRLGAGTDIPIGVPVAGRVDEALDELVGFFVNTLVLRTDLSGDPTFIELLGQVRDASLAAYDHQDLPFDRLVEELNPTRALSQHPLFQTMLVLQNNAEASLELPDLATEQLPVSRNTAKFDLTLTVSEQPDGLDCLLEFATDLYDVGTATTTLQRFVRVLNVIATAPDSAVSAAELLTPAERHWLLEAGTGPSIGSTDLVHAVFERQAADHPELPAVVFEDEAVSYAELNAGANRWARHLVGCGVRPGALVAVCLPRSAELVTMVLAVLKAGAGYLMLDPEHPAERLAELVERAQPALTVVAGPGRGFPGPLLVSAEQAATVAALPAENLDLELTPAGTACVMFTSGSTGIPKGVLTPHRAMVATLAGQRFAEAGPGQAWLQCSPVSWDAFALELFGALLSGGTCVLQPGQIPEPARIIELIARHQISVLHLSASLLNYLIDEYPDPFPGVAHLMTGGEPASVSHIERLMQHYPQLRVINGYSPLENTIFTLCHQVQPSDTTRSAIPIGRVLPGKQAYVLDTRLQLLPPGTPGELYMAGTGLAHGYHNQPAHTAHRFIANPYGPPGTRLYRTGDLVRQDHTGLIHYLGRTDNQIKIRGFRIEPEEVRAALLRHPSVRQCAVVVRQDVPGDPRLVGYLVADAELAVPEVRAFASGLLPDHLVPSAFVVVDELPRTPNGKLDRKALPAPAQQPTGARVPRTPHEQLLCDLYAEVLNLPSVSIDDGFFDLGGHSLLAARLVSRIRQVFEVELELRAIFKYPTVSGLVGQLGTFGQARAALQRMERPDRLPLSFAQQRLWFLDRVEGPNSAYNVPLAVRVRGPLEVAALELALADVMGRHEVLRTMFPDIDGQPYQLIVPAESAQPRLYRAAATAEELAALLDEAARQPFELSSALPVRAHLFVLGPADHVLLLVMHHIVSDGWSMTPLLRDLEIAYAARRQYEAPVWQPLPVQYADFALWQRDILGSEDDPTSLLSRQLTYWRKALADLPEEIALPVDRLRSDARSSRGRQLPIALDAGTHERLLGVARGCGATLFMVLQAAVACLLARLGAGVDVPLGTAVAGRTDAALDELVGFFVNTLVVRADLGGDPSFTELVARVREADLAAFGHQDVPFERVVEELNPARVPGRHPLFQVFVVMQNNAAATQELTGLTLERVETTIETAKFDLAVLLTETFDAEGRPAGITGVLEYAEDIFDESSIERLVGRFVGLVSVLVRSPEARVWGVEVLSARERGLLAGWNATEVEYPVEVPVHGVFEARVDAGPDAVAVEFGDQRVGYAQLDRWANRIARRLLAAGVGRGALVGVWIERGPGMVAALLGVLKAGAGYVPLDPGHPDERIAAIIEQARPALVLSQASIADRLPTRTRYVLIESIPAADRPDVDSSRPQVPVGPEDVACVLFTSGSTGQPKGVISPHRATVRTFTGQDYADFDQSWLQSAPISWDASALDLFGGLLSGGRCVLQPGQRPDPASIAQLVTSHQVKSVWLSAGLLATITDTHPHIFSQLHQVLTGGEAPSVAHLNQLRTQFPHLRLVHGYGPVESMVFSNTYQLTHTHTGRIPVGPPINNTQVHILDHRLNQLPPGAIGELYISGDGLAHGYLHQPSHTAERFTAHPHGKPGQRIYRTGDLARWNTHGNIEILGRADQQIKIRGFRIEPGEIETTLTNHPHITQAAVVTNTNPTTGTQLIGYVVGDIEPDELRTYAARQLPDYMVPSAFVVLEALPLTPNGKLDRKALPAPDQQVTGGRLPRTPRQQLLCAVFSDLLAVPGVSIDDDFFTLGGHSLLAARLSSRIRTIFGVELGIQAVFQARTVAALDALLDTLGTARPAIQPAPRPNPLPLSHAQQRLWLQEHLQGPSPVYNVPIALRLRGHLHPDALAAAIQDVVDRHEPLRTTYPQHNGQPHQHILPTDRAQIQLLPSTCTQQDLNDRLDSASQQPFDLANELPIRAHLFVLAPDDQVLLLVIHHIASDGWSMAPLLRDLSTAYTARRQGHTPDWQPLPVQYADYTLWQHQLLTDNPDSILTTQLDYWRNTLTNLPPQATLPPDHPRPAAGCQRGDVVPLWLDAQTHQGLLALATKSQATLFMVLQAGWAALLSRLGAGTDIPVGTAVAGRVDEALDDLVGFFVNTLVLRTDLSTNPTFTQLLNQVRDTTLAAYDHQDLPFDRLVEELNPTRTLTQHPLFQTMLVLQNNTQAKLQLPELQVTTLPISRAAAKFDLSMGMSERLTETGDPAGISGAVEFAAELYDTQTVLTLASRLQRWFAALVQTPDLPISAVELLSPAERQMITDDRNSNPAACTDFTVHQLIEAQAADHADLPAVIHQDEVVSYAELNRRANQLARCLRAEGVGDGALVGVCVPRGVRLVVAVLAVLKAGAGFVALDPGYPPQRLRELAEHAALTVTIVDSATRDLPVAGPVLDCDRIDVTAIDDTNLNLAVSSAGVMCVMFTSGSTGVPKGVVSSHRAVTATLVGQRFAEFGVGRMWLQCSPVSWDAFALELFGALLSGGTCVLQPGQIPEPARIVELVARHQVSVLHLSASLLNHLIDEYPDCFAGVGQLMTGGESALVGHIDRLLQRYPELRVINGYSPLESTIFTLCHQVQSGDTSGPTIPLGRALAGKQAYVLDAGLRLVPPGTPGELYLAGAGLAHGYLGQPALTAERFIANPYGPAGSRIYRTGDLVRQRHNGLIDYLGRTDHQIKIRGFRVEPEEIRATLLRHPSVRQADIAVDRDPQGSQRLLAYVVGDVDASELHAHATQNLPDYLIPGAFLVMDELPRTPNGKLDRAALPQPRVDTGERTPREELLASIFAELLQVESVSVNDGFFAMGGHSLLVIRLINRVRTVFGVELKVQTVFENPTVTALARQIPDSQPAAPQPARIALKPRSKS